MTSPQVIEVDTIQAKFYDLENLDGSIVEGEQLLFIDLTSRDGKDMGGLSVEDVVVRPLDRIGDGRIRVSVKHIMGRRRYVGPMKEDDYLLLSTHDGFQVLEDD